MGHDGELIRTSLTTPAAFGGIFESHYRAVDVYCVRRIGGDGHDVSAATFTEAFRVRERFDTTCSNARPWLYGIASNLLRHHRRRERNRWRAVARSEPTTATTFDADARVDAHRLGGRLAGALRATPTRDRDALLLYVWADLTYEQIAEALGIPVGTVRSRIARARGRLRAALADVVDADTSTADAPELSGVPDRGDGHERARRAPAPDPAATTTADVDHEGAARAALDVVVAGGTRHRVTAPACRRLVGRAVLATLVTATLVTGGVVVARRALDQSADRVRRVHVGANALDHAAPGAPTNILVIGSDSRAFVQDGAQADAFGTPTANPGKRSDTMILVHIDGDHATRGVDPA